MKVDHVDERGDGVRVAGGGTRWTVDRLVVCGGLQADRLARAAGLDPDFQIVPFRGEYYRLPDRLNQVINALIYPVPDPDLPFLGIHLTRGVDGSVSVGPNAVLSMAREGYSRRSVDLRDMATYTMARLLADGAGERRPGLSELHSAWSKRAYLRRCQRYCPSLGPVRPDEASQRHPGSGDATRRDLGPRLPDPADRSHAARMQCPLARCHLGPADRGAHRAPARLQRTLTEGGCPASFLAQPP